MSMKDFKNQLTRELSTMKFTRTTFKDYFFSNRNGEGEKYRSQLLPGKEGGRRGHGSQ